jgi:class 3 adenylate cyclase/tetratricopeptide (TPR) repeat protein
MSFDDLLNQTIDMLRRHKRVSYRALRRQFEVDDGYIEDLKSEIIEVLRLGVDEDGKVLVWAGEPAVREPIVRELGDPAFSAGAAKSSRGQDAAGDEAPGSSGSAGEKRRDVSPRPAAGERRHLTVMFCDLVDSTPLAERLDPEELGDVFGVWQDACAEAVAEHGGHISDYRGDGVFVYFGYPSAHEDGPHRALRAALGMLHRLDGVNARLQRTHATTLAVRIGIHTGLVLLSDLGGRFVRDQFALGETPNIAARLQAVAEENQIIVSGALRNLVRGYFTFDELGERNLKGVSKPVAACRVLGETDARERLQANEKGSTTFVARESEIAALRLRWALSLQGHGQAVLLIGEAGIGKSRLVRVATALADADSAQRVIMRCSPYHSASSLHPVIEHARQYLEIDRYEPAEANFSRLKRSLESSGLPDAARDAELIGGVLGLSLNETPLTQSLSAPQRRTQALEAMVRWTFRSAARRPLLFVVEDIHWADPSTLEFLGLLLESMSDQRVCLVITARPEYQLPFSISPNLTRIGIGRLSDSEAERLVDNTLRGRSVPDELKRQIVARADGVPLFIEELVAMIFESGMLREKGGHYVPMQPIASLPIPETLQDSLAARLDRLSEVRETAQLAAALGREFSFELIGAISALETSSLLASLDKLVDSELIQQQGVAPNAVYRFKHALIQDAAYQSMLKTRRQHYHQMIATTLEQRFGGIVEAQPEILAHHFTEAGLVDRARGCWLVAGEKALRRSANIEALHHLDRGLALLPQGEASPACARDELHLQMARGTALLMVKGQSAPEVEACFGRARELSRDLDDTPELFTVLFGLWRSHMARGSLQAARDIAMQLMGIADRIGDPALLLGAHSALGLVLYHRCDLRQALVHAEKGVLIHGALPAQAKASSIFNMGQHPGLACQLCMSFILVLTGAADRALACQRRGVEIAQQTGIPFQIATAAGWSLMLACLRRDSEAALESAEKVLALSREHVFPHWEFIGHFHRGILLVERGEHEEGLRLARAGIGAIDKLGFGNIRVRFHALIAEACGIAGQIEEGLTSLRQAFSSLEQSGEQWWKPELHRIEGELLRSANAGHEASEQCFWKALEIARSEGLRLFELRAAMSLSRVLRAQDKTEDARPILGAALAGFTEGFGTRDLIEARILLERLAH